MYTHLFSILFEGEHIIVILKQRLPTIVKCVRHHPKRVHITARATALAEDVLGSEVVQGWVGIEVTACVPLLECKRGLVVVTKSEHNNGTLVSISITPYNH